jgi:hypothetical protein
MEELTISNISNYNMWKIACSYCNGSSVENPMEKAIALRLLLEMRLVKYIRRSQLLDSAAKLLKLQKIQIIKKCKFKKSIAGIQSIPD